MRVERGLSVGETSLANAGALAWPQPIRIGHDEIGSAIPKNAGIFRAGRRKGFGQGAGVLRTLDAGARRAYPRSRSAGTSSTTAALDLELELLSSSVHEGASVGVASLTAAAVASGAELGAELGEGERTLPEGGGVVRTQRCGLAGERAERKHAHVARTAHRAARAELAAGAKALVATEATPESRLRGHARARAALDGRQRDGAFHDV